MTDVADFMRNHGFIYKAIWEPVLSTPQLYSQAMLFHKKETLLVAPACWDCNILLLRYTDEMLLIYWQIRTFIVLVLCKSFVVCFRQFFLNHFILLQWSTCPKSGEKHNILGAEDILIDQTSQDNFPREMVIRITIIVYPYLLSLV